jgi:uncharacterized protein (DUF433 family)
MSLVLEADVLPMKADPHGTVRVAGTRVTLDTLVGFYGQGYTAEQLHDSFPTVPLADIHAVIAYYLRHKQEVDAYIEAGVREGEEQRRKFEAQFPPRPIRPELLAKLRTAGEAHDASAKPAEGSDGHH